jgi:predicted RNA binding protein YcfA (HicA-like mRNA interferase family)
LPVDTYFGFPFPFVVGIITTMNSKQIIKQLEADGWILARVKGSHHQFKHPAKPGLVTVKHPDSDIPPVRCAASANRRGGNRRLS